MDRRRWLKQTASWLLGAVGASIFPHRHAHAIGRSSNLAIAQLQYEGGLWQPREQAVEKMLFEVEKRTSIAINQRVTPLLVPLKATDDALFYHPILLWTGDRGFPALSDEEIRRLGIFLQAGGFLIIDDCEGGASAEFDRSIRRDIARIFPDKPLASIDRDHVLFKSFYLLDARPWGRVDVARDMQGVALDERLAIVYSRNDLQGAWARDDFGQYLFHDIAPEGERQREYTYRYGVNLVMYALCINYKADQVHIPFILKRRDWMAP